MAASCTLPSATLTAVSCTFPGSTLAAVSCTSCGGTPAAIRTFLGVTLAASESVTKKRDLPMTSTGRPGSVNVTEPHQNRYRHLEDRRRGSNCSRDAGRSHRSCGYRPVCPGLGCDLVLVL